MTPMNGDASLYGSICAGVCGAICGVGCPIAEWDVDCFVLWMVLHPLLTRVVSVLLLLLVL